MTFHLPATEGGSLLGGKEYRWFMNASNQLEYSPLGDAFKKKYGYRVYWLSSPDGAISRRFVEFPNEEEATMFVLRWG